MVIPKHIKTFLQELFSYLILIALVLGINALITNAIIKHQCNTAVEKIIEKEKDIDRTYIIKKIHQYTIEQEENNADNSSCDEQIPRKR